MVKRFRRRKSPDTLGRKLTIQGLESRRLLAADSGLAFAELQDETVQIGSPLHIPVDVLNPSNSDNLSISVDVAAPGHLKADVVEGNRSIRITVRDFGEMVFELYEQRAPQATARVIELAESGFYDGIEFHRVVDNFVLQAGDPTATGTGGSTLGDFDDEFHPELQHNRVGVLSYAKAGDDTNDSQFFITEVATRFLDFNHSVFGQLVEGESVREAISAVDVNQANKPIAPVVIESVEVFHDTENSVVLLQSRNDTPGTTQVTFTVTNGDGESFSQTINVEVTEDSANSQPFLEPVDLPSVFAAGSPATFQISSIDVEGDEVEYVAATTGVPFSVDEFGTVTVTPPADFTGFLPMLVGVRPGPNVVGNGANDLDSQRIDLFFSASTLDLNADSDSGFDGTDNITNESELEFEIGNVTTGATIDLIVQDQVIGSAIAEDGQATISTEAFESLGDGVYQVTARETVEGRSTDVAILSITIDTTVPAERLSNSATEVFVGDTVNFDLSIGRGSETLRYTLIDAPEGVAVDNDGQLTWSTLENQVGRHLISVRVQDEAGNSVVDELLITVHPEFLATVRFEFVGPDGSPIDTVNVGESAFLNVYLDDNRPAGLQNGIFGGYLDISFDTLSATVPQLGSIQYGESFTALQDGTITDGRIDELGATLNVTEFSNAPSSLLATVRFESIELGTLNVQGSPSNSPHNEFLMFGINDVVASTRVQFGSDSLTVLDPTFHREALPSDVNGDGKVTALDALNIINAVNQAKGPISLDSSFVAELKPFAFNASGDDRISALDALHVINDLLRANTAESEISDAQTSDFLHSKDVEDADIELIDQAIRVF